MNRLEEIGSRAIYKIELSGGQNRLKEAILYVCQKAAGMKYFAAIKLNKILWRADFRAYSNRSIPVTGRQYQRLRMGPAPVEMPPIINDMLRNGLISIERRKIGRFQEMRHIPKVEPVLRYFSSEDLEYLDESLDHYRNVTGTEASDQSHGVVWKTREDGDPIPYQAAFLDDASLSQELIRKLAALAKNKNWQSH